MTVERTLSVARLNGGTSKQLRSTVPPFYRSTA
jgi:hypothetical protein